MSSEKQEKREVSEAERKQALIDSNLRFYVQGCDVPQDALKGIKAGRLKGMSDVNPMWRMKRMTEIFGPVGFGWRYEIIKMWTEEFIHEEKTTIQEYQPFVPAKINDAGQVVEPAIQMQPRIERRNRIYEVKCFCNVNLYVRDPETKEWSAPIPGNGGSAIVANEKGGPYVNDEGYKMALTDALSIAMKPLGIGGNIWYGPKATGHNESKYEAATRCEDNRQTYQSQQTQQAVSQVAFTGEQLKAALQELEAITTEQQFYALWDKWSQSVPAMCQNGTEFYQKCCQKLYQINESNAAQ